MSPRLRAAKGRAILQSTIMMLRSIEHPFYVPGHPEFESDHAELQHLIRERDDIVLDESTLTPECIGQLMGGN